MPEPTIKDIRKDIYLVLHKTQQMLDLTADAFLKNRASKLDEAVEISKEIHKKEDNLTDALAKMGASSSEAKAILSVPSHLEKIASSIERIIDHSRNKIREGMLFSDKALQESGTLFSKTRELLKKAAEGAITGPREGGDGIKGDSDAIIRLTNDYAAAHEERLVTGECSPKSSSTYLCILYAFDDIASHAKEAVRKLASK